VRIAATSRETAARGGRWAFANRRRSSPPTWPEGRPPSRSIKSRPRHLNIAHGLYPLQSLDAETLRRLVDYLQRSVRVEQVTSAGRIQTVFMRWLVTRFTWSIIVQHAAE
jgi:hypothetical protein